MPKFRVFTDESCTNKQHFAIGGIWLDTSIEADVRTAIEDLRTSMGFTAVFKWNYLCPAKLPFYDALIDLFFNFEDKLAFNAILVDKAKVDYKQFHQNDEMVGYNKFYYQLLAKRTQVDSVYIVRVDPHPLVSGDDWDVVKRYVNNFCGSRPGYAESPLRHLYQERVFKDDLSQLADVLLGAVASEANGLYTGDGKRAAVRQILGCSGLQSITQNSPRHYNKMNIWRWHP